MINPVSLEPCGSATVATGKTRVAVSARVWPMWGSIETRGCLCATTAGRFGLWRFARGRDAFGTRVVAGLGVGAIVAGVGAGGAYDGV